MGNESDDQNSQRALKKLSQEGVHYFGDKQRLQISDIVNQSAAPTPEQVALLRNLGVVTAADYLRASHAASEQLDLQHQDTRKQLLKNPGYSAVEDVNRYFNEEGKVTSMAGALKILGEHGYEMIPLRSVTEITPGDIVLYGHIEEPLGSKEPSRTPTHAALCIAPLGKPVEQQANNRVYPVGTYLSNSYAYSQIARPFFDAQVPVFHGLWAVPVEFGLNMNVFRQKKTK